MQANEVINELIKKYGFSQQAIADYLKCHQTAVSLWAENKRKITLKYAIPLVKLARKKGIKVKVEDFVS